MLSSSDKSAHTAASWLNPGGSQYLQACCTSLFFLCGFYKALCCSRLPLSYRKRLAPRCKGQATALLSGALEYGRATRALWDPGTLQGYTHGKSHRKQQCYKKCLHSFFFYFFFKVTNISRYLICFGGKIVYNSLFSYFPCQWEYFESDIWPPILIGWPHRRFKYLVKVKKLWLDNIHITYPTAFVGKRGISLQK